MAAPSEIKGIDCNDTAAAGIGKALAERFNDMHVLRSTALEWEDLEGVHSMRVASRRLRSAVGDFAPYMHKRKLSSALKEVKIIADALGEVRDLDVALEALEELSTAAPAEYSKTLQELIDARKQKRAESREELEKILIKSRLDNLSSDFANALLLATYDATTVKNPQISFIEMARAIIRDRLKDLEGLSSSFYRPMATEQLHEMRIAAKHLRYSIELFETCWGSTIARFAKQLARLQTALGGVHDCDVWIESFWSEVKKSRRLKDPERLSTFNWLFKHFNELRHKQFTKAFSVWTTWEANESPTALIEALKE